MKIITWNCNLNFSKKFENIEAFHADIIIIQECERLRTDFFPNHDFFWTGRIENKGLGIMISKSTKAKVSDLHNTRLINFLPIETEGLNILGVWAYNHRAAKFGNDASGNTSDALSFYKNWLAESEVSIFGGDFNNSVVWDKGDNENNFSNINSSLNNLEFMSIYHHLTEEDFGSEKDTTFFHTKKEIKSYHIDYLFLKGMEVKTLDIGSYEDWIKYSDHVPLICEIKN